MYKDVYKWIRIEKYKTIWIKWLYGNFDSCDLPPISLFWHSPTPCNTVIPEIFYLLNIQSASGIPDQKFCDGRWATEESACRFFCPRTHPRYARQHVPCLFAGDLPPAGSQPTVSPLRWRYCFTRSITPFFIRRFYSFNSWRKNWPVNFTNNQTVIKINFSFNISNQLVLFLLSKIAHCLTIINI